VKRFLTFFQKPFGRWLVIFLIQLVTYTVSISIIYFALGSKSGVSLRNLFSSPILYIGLVLIVMLSVFRVAQIKKLLPRTFY